MSPRIEQIRDAVQVMHGCAAEHIESVPLVEMFRDKVMWQGVVEVFSLVGHPKTKRAYAWSYPENGETKFVAVLELPPVNSPQTAVRASIVAHNRPRHQRD